MKANLPLRADLPPYGNSIFILNWLNFGARSQICFK